jgi:hypothetical protein
MHSHCFIYLWGASATAADTYIISVLCSWHKTKKTTSVLIAISLWNGSSWEGWQQKNLYLSSVGHDGQTRGWVGLGVLVIRKCTYVCSREMNEYFLGPMLWLFKVFSPKIWRKSVEFRLNRYSLGRKRIIMYIALHEKLKLRKVAQIAENSDVIKLMLQIYTDPVCLWICLP